MISLTQCMVLGGLGSNETIFGVAPCAKHHSLLLSYLSNLERARFRARYDYCRLRSYIDIGAMQQAADLLVVFRLFFSEYPEAVYVPRLRLAKGKCCEIISNRDPIQHRTHVVDYSVESIS